MKTLKRLLFFIAGICLLMACSKSDQSGFDLSGLSGYNLSMNPNKTGAIIVVEPNGSDDTENLNNAFIEAINAGSGSTVQLTEGPYFINFMVVRDFKGYLKGAGKDVTILSPIPGLHCQTLEEGMIPTKLLRFLGGDVTISDMTFRVEDIEYCLDPVGWQYLSAILYFGNNNSLDPNPYLRAEVKNVDFEGKLSEDQPTWHKWLSAIMVGDPWQTEESVPDYNVDLTVNGCNFTEVDVGISYCMVRQGNLKAGNASAPNNFSNCIYGFLFEDNLNSSIDISYNNIGYLWSAMWFMNRFHHQGAKMVFNVNNNKFYPGSVGWPAVIIYDFSNVDNPMQGKITNNLFTLNEGVWGGIESWSSKNLMITNNKFTGSGQKTGIFIDGFGEDKVDIPTLTTNVLIKDNDFSTLNVPYSDIYLGERSMSCKVNGVKYGGNIINIGQKNIIIGMNVLPYEGPIWPWISN